MSTKLRNVVAAVYDRPWHIIPEQLRVIDQLVQMHVAGGRLSDAELHQRLDAAAAVSGPRRGPRTAGAVAVIPIYGTIFPRSNLMTDFSGGATVEGIRGSFRDALADETVGSILFDIDSPGGYTDGIEELAAEILAARGQKPMLSIADYTMASAAYYLGCSADEISASPSAAVGWIGTVMVHQEFSKMDAEAGVTTTIFRDPPGKYGGNKYEPLSDQTAAEWQRDVDDLSGQFHAHVARARGVTTAKVRADYGQGGGMQAARAVTAGLVDRVESYDEALRRLATGQVASSSGRSSSAAPRRVEATDVVPAAGELEEPIQGGDVLPTDDPEAPASGEVGTPPADDQPALETLDAAEIQAMKRRADRRGKES